MKHTIPLFLFFLFVHLVTCRNIIHSTCKKLSKSDPNINYKFCVTSLQSGVSNYTNHSCPTHLNLFELGLVSLNLTKRNASDTRHYVKELLKRRTLDTYITACLNDCFDLYDNAVSTLKEGIKDYEGKRFRDANVEVSSVIDAATTCEDGFNERQGVVSPLSRRNNDTFQLGVISLSIINLLD